MSVAAPTTQDQSRDKPGLLWWLLLLSAPLLLLLAGVSMMRLFAWAAAQPGYAPFMLARNLGLVILPLLAFALVAALAAMRYVRYRTAAGYQNKIQGMANRQNYHQDLLRLIADNLPGATMIIDAEHRLWFVNSRAAQRMNMPVDKAFGRPLENSMPEGDALRITAMMRDMRVANRPMEVVNKVKDNGAPCYIQTRMVPLPDVASLSGAVMVNEDDVTSLLVEREARERMFRQVIDTLVAVVDRRDPYAAGHSLRVGQVARALAGQLDLDRAQIETAEIAGLLMNFGKILVPRAILIKTGALSPDELKQVHDALLSSADILALIGFELPVVPTLRQALERFDGSGVPAGLKGDAILITARIITVANAFVALLSARAHRPSVDVRGAIQVLRQNADKIYDGGIIDALESCIAAHGKQMSWLPQ